MSKSIAFAFCLCLASSLPVSADEAKLRQGDTIELRFRGIPESEQASLSGAYRIDDSGLIKLPYLKPFKIAGLTPSQCERSIERRYTDGEIFSDPAVTIAADPVKTVRTVTVLGEVADRGAVPYSDSLTAIAAIGVAKGFSDFADPSRVQLVREGKSRRLDLSRAANKDAQLRLRPGDVITVPPDRRPFR